MNELQHILLVLYGLCLFILVRFPFGSALEGR